MNESALAGTRLCVALAATSPRRLGAAALVPPALPDDARELPVTAMHIATTRPSLSRRRDMASVKSHLSSCNLQGFNLPPEVAAQVLDFAASESAASLVWMLALFFRGPSDRPVTPSVGMGEWRTRGRTPDRREEPSLQRNARPHIEEVAGVDAEGDAHLAAPCSQGAGAGAEDLTAASRSKLMAADVPNLAHRASCTAPGVLSGHAAATASGGLAGCGLQHGSGDCDALARGTGRDVQSAHATASAGAGTASAGARCDGRALGVTSEEGWGGEPRQGHGQESGGVERYQREGCEGDVRTEEARGVGHVMLDVKGYLQLLARLCAFRDGQPFSSAVVRACLNLALPVGSERVELVGRDGDEDLLEQHEQLQEDAEVECEADAMANGQERSEPP